MLHGDGEIIIENLNPCLSHLPGTNLSFLLDEHLYMRILQLHNTICTIMFQFWCSYALATQLLT